MWVTQFAEATAENPCEMTMVWTLTPTDGGTRVAVEARDVPPAISAEDHAAGLLAGSPWERARVVFKLDQIDTIRSEH